MDLNEKQKEIYQEIENIRKSVNTHCTDIENLINQSRVLEHELWIESQNEWAKLSEDKKQEINKLGVELAKEAISDCDDFWAEEKSKVIQHILDWCKHFNEDPEITIYEHYANEYTIMVAWPKYGDILVYSYESRLIFSYDQFDIDPPILKHQILGHQKIY